MKQIRNPLKLQDALDTLPMSDIFSKDYSEEFLLLEYEKGEFLIREGDQNNYLFFTFKGTVKCFSYATNGKEQFITYLKDSDAVGLVGSIWGKPAISNIQAIHKCQCLALPLTRCRHELLDDNKFLRYLCQQLGDTLASCDSYLRVVQCSSTESKIAAVICSSMADGVCALNLSATAEVVGTTYRHVLRVLNRFCGDGILEKCGKGYLVKDEAYLSICAEDASEYMENRRLRTT